MVHLTNDAVQKKGEEYGKFENGNKVTANFSSIEGINSFFLRIGLVQWVSEIPWFELRGC